jgi:uncharacterized protein YndB with AHSA1/START domain
MSTAAQRIAPAPIVKQFRVKASPDRAFDVFAKRMGAWWLKSHSVLSSPQKDIVIEPFAGGRWYEVGEDGSTYDWGRVLEWSPPHRLVLDWQLSNQFAFDPALHTTVDVRFEADGAFTLVSFEHRDLENFGAGASETRDGMDEGWGSLLAACEAAFG